MHLKEEIQILIIDDEDAIRESFAAYLEDEGYRVLTAGDGAEGLSILKSNDVQTVLTDLRMPRMDGLDVLREGIKIRPEIPFIVISGTGEVGDIIQAIQAGAWDYIEKPLNNMDFLNHQIQKNLEKYFLSVENKKYRNHLEELVEQRTFQLEQKNRELEVSRREIIEILSEAAEYRDFETGQHFIRVSRISGILAGASGLSGEMVETIELTAPVHDIGKIGIPDRILLKPGPLTDEEWEEMKRHCQYGREILTSRKKHFHSVKSLPDQTVESNSHYLLEQAAVICQNHHEHWDGNGYPRGISGEDIPLSARITAVADVYDALLSKRPYKEPWEEKKVLNLLKNESGHQFDPQLIRLFFDHLHEIQDSRRDLTDNLKTVVKK